MDSRSPILLVTSETGFGGGERIFLDLFEFLQKKGHSVICLLPVGSALENIIDSSCSVSRHVEILDLSKYIVIVNDFQSLYKMTFRRRKRTIFICHGPWQMTGKMKIYLKIARVEVFFVSSYVMSFANKGVSLNFKRMHTLQYKPNERFFTEQNSSDRIQARDALNLPRNRIIVCTHSRYHSSKKLEIFLEAVIYAGMVPLLSMVGGTRTSMESELEQNLKNRFEGKEFFLYSEIDPLELFMASDIYLSTSELETLGVSLMEACAFGLPIVTSAKGGTHDFLFDGINCFKSKNDIESIASQLHGIINQKDLAIPMKSDYRGTLKKVEKFGSLMRMIDE